MKKEKRKRGMKRRIGIETCHAYYKHNILSRRFKEKRLTLSRSILGS